MNEIILDENIVRRIVRAIDKALADDIPQYLQEHHKETNNAIIQLRGDYINENLRSFVVTDDVKLIPFKRYSWHGRLLADHKNKITYSITSQSNLHAIPKKKDRTRPHFLQSILAQENGNYEGQYIQESLFPMDMFDEETLENDYNDIIAGMLNPSEGYRHYVISYNAVNGELLDVKLEFLDKHFSTIAEASLNSYINPDFARLTNSETDNLDVNADSNENVRDILGLKAGLRPKLKEIEKEA